MSLKILNLSGALRGGAVSSVAPFSPLSVSGCVGWYDASNSASITLRSSTYVTQWNDLSTNAKNLTQSTTTNQPAIQTAYQGGKNAILFTSDSSFNKAISQAELNSIISYWNTKWSLSL